MRKNRHFLTSILLLVTMGLHAQMTQITGKITDPTGTPIPGATIKLKNGKGGTSADASGAFTIKAPLNSTLLVSGIGYETKEVKLGTSSVLNITLNTDTRSLNEVVVTGVGVATSKKHLGFAVESVSGEKLPPVPIASIDQALVGKIAGAQISTVSGNPGDQVNIVLRGINTVQNGTRPLVMMDGVEIPFANLSTLDLSQVARVEVVQGAASSALYGAQGANGVIQIFTKKGQRGKSTINFSSSYGTSSFINAGHFQNAALHPYLTDANGNIIAFDNGGGYTPGQPLIIDPTVGAVLGDFAYK